MTGSRLPRVLSIPPGVPFLPELADALLSDRLGIGRLGEHGALADAYATYDVLVKLLERAEKSE